MPGHAYPDSSFLVSIYKWDANQATAHAFMAKHSPTLTFLPLHRVELRNALRLAESRGFLTPEDRRVVFRQIDEDLQEEVLIHSAVSWHDIFRRADDLSEMHMTKNGQRTLDLLHVAAALESGTKLFLSFDQRQRGLAKTAGLQVKP
jgi:predicted nucleic acid-binding protein